MQNDLCAMTGKTTLMESRLIFSVNLRSWSGSLGRLFKDAYEHEPCAMNNNKKERKKTRLISFVGLENCRSGSLTRLRGTRLKSVFLNFPTSHNTQFQSPNRRSISFQWVLFKLQGGSVGLLLMRATKVSREVSRLAFTACN